MQKQKNIPYQNDFSFRNFSGESRFIFAASPVEKETLKENIKGRPTWKDAVPKLHDELQKLGSKDQNDYLTEIDNWTKTPDNIEKVYNYFFGEEGKRIRAPGNQNVFGEDIDDKDPEKIKLMEERLLIIRHAYAGIVLPEKKQIVLEKKYGKLEHKPYLEARKETLEKNSHFREGMVFKALNGSLKEAMQSYNTASKADKWKYMASAAILAVGAFWLLKKAWNNKVGKGLVIGGAALYAANVISGIASKDKQTLLERVALSSPKPGQVNQTIIDRMKLSPGEAEQMRSMIVFNGIGVTDLCDHYLKAKRYGEADNKNFQSFYTGRMRRIEPGKRNRVQPKEAYEVADGYFTHMGNKYFEEAKGSGALEKLFNANQKGGNPFSLQSKELLEYKEIPTGKTEKTRLGILLFRESHLGHTFFDANWAEYSNEKPGMPFLSVGFAVEKAAVGSWEIAAHSVHTACEYWENPNNRQKVIDLFKQYGLELKLIVWDRGLEKSWEFIKPYLQQLKDHPVESLIYVGEKTWEIVLVGGKKVRILVDKSTEVGKEMYKNTVEYWKDDAEAIAKFWNEFADRYYGIRGKEVIKWYIDGGKMVIQYGKEKWVIMKNSKAAGLAEGAHEWTITKVGAAGETIHVVAKDIVAELKRWVGLGKLSDITLENLPPVKNSIEKESQKRIKDAVKSMADSQEMRDIFLPLMPLMENAEEDIGTWYYLGLDSVDDIFKGIFTGNAGPVNENQWAALVAYKQHEMVLFYQNILEKEATENSGKINVKTIEKIEKSFKEDYLKPISNEGIFADSKLKNDIIDKTNSWWSDTDAEDYREALAGLLSLGARNEAYSTTLKDLVAKLEKIDFEGRDKGKYANQLKAITLWKFAERAAPLAILSSERKLFRAEAELTETHQEYLGALSNSLIKQLKDFENNDIFDNTVNTPEVAKVFRGELSAPTFEEFVAEKAYKKSKNPETFFNWMKEKNLQGIEKLSKTKYDNTVSFEKDGDKYWLVMNANDSFDILLDGSKEPKKSDIKPGNLPEVLDNLKTRDYEKEEIKKEIPNKK